MKTKILGILTLLVLGYFGARAFAVTILPEYATNKGISIIRDRKKVHIHGYKAFNAGVLKVEDGYVFASRKRADSLLESLWQRHVCRNNIKGIVIGELDDTFQEKSKTTYHHNNEKVEGLDIQYIDPRLIKVGKEIYMIYCRQLNRKTRATSEAHLYLAKLEKKEGFWKIMSDRALIFNGAKEFYEKGLVQRGFEKNWMPFSENGELYFIYLMEPEHVVLKTNLETAVVDICSRTKNVFKGEVTPPRGSSPAVFDEELGEWITCYHYVYPTKRRIIGESVDAYFFGVYSFSKDAPYTILRRTDGPLIGEGLYDNFRKIIFPTSLVRDGDSYLLFYGDDDLQNCVARISRKELIASMKEADGN